MSALALVAGYGSDEEEDSPEVPVNNSKQASGFVDDLSSSSSSSIFGVLPQPKLVVKKRKAKKQLDRSSDSLPSPSLPSPFPSPSLPTPLPTPLPNPLPNPLPTPLPAPSAAPKRKGGPGSLLSLLPPPSTSSSKPLPLARKPIKPTSTSSTSSAASTAFSASSASKPTPAPITPTPSVSSHVSITDVTDEDGDEDYSLPHSAFTDSASSVGPAFHENMPLYATPDPTTYMYNQNNYDAYYAYGDPQAQVPYYEQYQTPVASPATASTAYADLSNMANSDDPLAREFAKDLKKRGNRIVEVRAETLAAVDDHQSFMNAHASQDHQPVENTNVTARFWDAKQGAVAATSKPTKTHKRKHQINSLAAESKAKELQLRQIQLQGAKHRKIAATRYGW